MDDVYVRYCDALRLGHQRAAEGRFKDALGHYRAASALAGERALPLVGVGGMLLHLGRARDALAAFERALECEPGDQEALSGRAAALLALGRRAESAQVQALIHGQREQVVGSAPASATDVTGADNLLAAGEQARAAGRIGAAIDAWLAESAEHCKAERYDAALDACLRALALDTSAARTHLELARVWLVRGWQDLARERIQLLGRLLVLQPDERVSAALRSLSATTQAASATSAAR